MPSCLICENSIDPFMSFGEMPVANGFLHPEKFDQEYFFDLKVGYCENCHMVQLTELVDPTQLFHSEYAYFSSISVRMAQHFEEFAKMVRENYLHSDDPLIVEIGSNDGIMLQNFARFGYRHVGIEPSANVAKIALEKDIHTIVRFFDEQAGIELHNEYGPADAILGANVICHIPNIHSIIKGVLVWLKPKGVFIFEEPYLGDILEKTSYDQIYDEHVFYFSLTSLNYLFAQYGLEIVNIESHNVHGGSMRYVVARKGMWPIDPKVSEQLKSEEKLGLASPQTFEKLKENIYNSRDQLLDKLRTLNQQGKRIVGYGATSKSTTVTNFCGIGPDLIEFISDTTPTKIGKYSPGAHIPIRPYDDFIANYPDYALLFAWNHAEEIIAKEDKFKEQGGKFVVYVPKVQVLD